MRRKQNDAKRPKKNKRKNSQPFLKGGSVFFLSFLSLWLVLRVKDGGGVALPRERERERERIRNAAI